MKTLVFLFDKLNSIWSHQITARLLSNILIIIFAVVLGAVALNHLNIFSLRFEHTDNYFLAVDASFTALLIFEILGLIFVLPRSVADSVGKQFEILSIILLRATFKEFGHISSLLVGQHFEFSLLLPMLSDAIGALIIFAIIGYYYRIQKHSRITKSVREQSRFIQFKKVISLLLLISFLMIGAGDIKELVTSGHYDPSFNAFYTILIFADILILLYSLRYHSQYTNLFRYSSFAFATVLIRLSLSAPPFINAITGVAAGVFVLGLTFVYNNFKDGISE